MLVAVAGLMSGLTLGLLSLDTVDLEMILRGPESRQKKYARGIQPLMKDSHRLLVTLVLCNAAAMEALPMLVDRLTSPLISLILSVTVVLLFGEIMPQGATLASLAQRPAPRPLAQAQTHRHAPITRPPSPHPQLSALATASPWVTTRHGSCASCFSSHSPSPGPSPKSSTPSLAAPTGASTGDDATTLAQLTADHDAYKSTTGRSIASAALQFRG